MPLERGQKEKSMKYDDVDWHVGGDFPKELDVRAARTHIGIFLAWAVAQGLESEMLRSQYPDRLHDLRAGVLKGTDVLEQCCDDKLTNDDLSDLGNSFARDYYETSYLDDYVNLSDDALPTIYHELETPEKYQQVSRMLDKRYREWKDKRGVD